MVDVEKDKTKGEEVHEEIQRIRYALFFSPPHSSRVAALI
jgi:hypothetical protein